MSKNSAIGKIFRIDPVETNPKSGYQSRNLYIDCSYTNNGETRANFLKFIFTGEKMAMLDQFQVGQLVTVEYFMQGRFYKKLDGNEGFFQDAKGFSIQPYQRKGGYQPPQGYTNPATGDFYPYQQQPQVNQQGQPQYAPQNNGPDELPF